MQPASSAPMAATEGTAAARRGGEQLSPAEARAALRFYERLRVDMIEAQCALASGRPARAAELIDAALLRARIAAAACGPARGRRRATTRRAGAAT